MAINRFDKIPRYDWSWQTAIPKLPELNFEGLDQVLQATQGQIDQPKMVSQMRPNALNTVEDKALLQQYNQFVDQGVQRVADAYKQGIQAGKAANNQFIYDVKEQWTPGGTADLLNKRYQNAAARQKELETFYKDDKRGINKTLALKQFQDEINAPIGYDPQSRTGKQDFTVSTVNDPDLRKAADDMLKEIKESGDTQFLGNTNKDWWLTKIKTETRPAEQIRLAFQALAEQPEFAGQLDRDAQYKAISTDPKKYQQNYESGLDNQLRQIEKTIEEAKSDPLKTKQLQQTLADNGYNITVDGQFGQFTEKAAKEFVDSQKQLVKEQKGKFDLLGNLRQDVYNDYENYALRGAYTKVDKDLIFNKAMDAKLDYQTKNRANDIAARRLEYEMKAEPNSNIFVGSGVAQQLPKLFDYASNLKKQATDVKQNFQKTLDKSAFKGWTPENIATAYDLWEKTNGDPAAFEQALRGNSSYNFTTKDIDAITTELQLPLSESGIKQSLDNLNDVTQDNLRMEKALSKVGEQYVNTPEGKKNLEMLNQFRKPNESDGDLINRSLSNPDEFKKSTRGVASYGNVIVDKEVNVAELFNRTMKEDVQKQSEAGTKYDWNGALGTYEVYAGTGDKTLRPILDNYMKFIENSNGTKNLVSFGSTTLKFEDGKGEQIKPESFDLKNIAVGKNLSGEPVLKISGTVKEGKTTKTGFTEVNIVPGSPEHIAVLRGMEQAYISKVSNGEIDDAEGILDNIEALNGKDGSKQAAGDLIIGKLNTTNTALQPIYFKNQNGQFEDMSQRKWRTSQIGNPMEVGGRQYIQMGVLPPDDKGYTMIVTPDAQGNMVAVPDQKGNILHKSTSGITKLLTGKQTLAKANVEVTETKR